MSTYMSCFSRIMATALILASLATAFATPVSAQTRDYWKRYAERLPIGSNVQVRTTAGERITAVLTIVDDNGITLLPKTRIPEPPRQVPYDGLQQLELKQNGGSSVGKAIGIGVGVGVATFFG